MQKWFIALRNVIVLTVLSVTVPLIATHALIITVDPIGAYTNEINWHVIAAITEEHPTGVMALEGTYQLRGYEVTMLTDGLRYVPGSTNSACTIAFVGDSFTWGYGVNDEETFANQVAQSVDANVINVGRNGYNTVQVLVSRNYYDANLYVYLHVWNDHQPPAEVVRHTPRSPLLTYWQSVGQNSIAMFGYIANKHPINEPYRQAMTELANDDNVLIFAFEDAPFSGLGTYASDTWQSVVLLPDSLYIHDTVSYSDPHPNATGHQQIADAMLATIESRLEQVCN